MERKQIKFTANKDEIDSHLQKLYKKIELQGQLHHAFLYGKREIDFIKKDDSSLEKNNFKINFSIS